MLLTVIIDRLLLRPLLRVMNAREQAIRSARELAERSANQARAAAAEFEQKTTAARAEIYKQMDEMRRAATPSAPKRWRTPAPRPTRRSPPRRTS